VQTNASRPSKRQLWKRVAFAAILVFTIYTLCGFFLFPHLIRNQIVSEARTLLHREARMDEVRFNPFTLATNITGFVLSEVSCDEI
jgi:hypothetical protein